LPLLVSACVPKLETSIVYEPYPLMDFAGPDTLPAAPDGTFPGIDMTGPWRVVSVSQLGGATTVEHLFQPGWYLLATETTVSSIQGVPPEWFLPFNQDWQLNRVDDTGVALGFGFSNPRNRLDFLHYAFIAAPEDINHARALEALHFADAQLGTITWAMWSVELERVQRPPVVEEEPAVPSWPR
jgi:hypothetical protein